MNRLRLTLPIAIAAAGILALDPAPAVSQFRTRSEEIGAPGAKDGPASQGRYVFAGVGIDAYQAGEIWKELDNAVNDVVRVRETLQEDFGFESPDAWVLTDEEATAAAIRGLVDRLRQELQPDDNLVFFFAGHGAEIRDVVGGQEVGRTGFVVPVDVSLPVNQAPSQYLEIEDLLEALARLPARHVLVILDSCYSGMALEGTFKTRGGNETQQAKDLIQRVSRRVLTSAQADQLAADGGADFPENSLFTGWLVEGLRQAARGDDDGESPDADRDGMVTVTELYAFVRGRVGSDSQSRQTPDFGAFELDQRGELVLTLERDPFDALYAEAVEAYELDKLEQFYQAAEEALGLRPEGARASYLRYLTALTDGDDGLALVSLRDLGRRGDAGEDVPMNPRALANRLRQMERLCAKAGCEVGEGQP